LPLWVVENRASPLLWSLRVLTVLCLCPPRPLGSTDISATVAPIGVKFCTIVQAMVRRTGLLLLFGGVAPRDPRIRNFGPKFWPFDRECLENSSLKLARRELSKNV